MRKRLSALLLSVLMLVTMLPVTAFAADENVLSGTCGATENDNVTWTLTQNNEDSDNTTYTLTISGEGAMADYTGTSWNATSDCPWENYRQKITKLELSDEITYLGNYAFTNCSNMEFDLTKFINVTKGTVGEHCFDSCAKVTGNDLYINFDTTRSDFAATAISGVLKFGPNVTTIGQKGTFNGEDGGYVFNGCKQITKIDLEDAVNLKTIMARVFTGMSGVTSISWPKNFVLEIPGDKRWRDFTFAYNTNMEGSFSDFLIRIKANGYAGNLFYGCGKMTGTLQFTDDTEIIPSLSFSKSGVTFVKLPASLTTIGTQAFKDCADLLAIDATVVQGDVSFPLTQQQVNEAFFGLPEGSAIYLDHADQITFFAVTNGGTFESDTTFEASKLATPIKNGFKFDGWYTDDECTDENKVADNVAVAGNTYYAKWTAKLTQDAPAAPTLKDRTYTSITLNAVANAEYSKDGGQTWQPSPEFTGLTSDTTYTFAVRYAETDDYLASPASETADFATLRHSSGGSSSGSTTTTTNTVSASTASNGKVSLDKSTAKKGDTVTITVTPDTGYELGELTVTDSKGNTIAVSKKGDNQYTFTMPDGKVTVTPTFTKIADENPSEITYTDVADKDWFADAVAYVTNKSLMGGTGDNKFSPSASTTRGMLMTVLARYAGADTTNSTPWYQAGMDWAKANGVSDGTNPTVNITREQLVTMLYRYAGSPSVNGSLSDFSDASTVSSYAVNAMQWAVENGIVNGSNGKLNPKNNATRAEVAAILMRYCEMGK